MKVAAELLGLNDGLAGIISQAAGVRSAVDFEGSGYSNEG